MSQALLRAAVARRELAGEMLAAIEDSQKDIKANALPRSLSNPRCGVKSGDDILQAITRPLIDVSLK